MEPDLSKREGEINPEGVAFYHTLIDRLVASGIEPVVTLYHFDLPLALYENGGWSNRETIDAFAQYAKTLFQEYGDKVKYWLTINEQNVMINHPAAMNPGKTPTNKRALPAKPPHAFGGRDRD